MTPITVTCLGHGGAFSPLSVGNTSFLIDHGDRRILIDCGTTVPETLAEIGVDPGSITHCLITHLHADHVGGLERLLYHRRYISKTPPLDLIMGHLVADAWIATNRILSNDLLTNAFIDYCIDGEWVDDAPGEDFEVFARRVHHGGDIPNMPGYCYLVTLGASALFFSGDRIWEHEGANFVRKDMSHADLAFHELELLPNPSGAHTHQSDVSDVCGLENVRWTHHGKPCPDPFFKLAFKGDQWRVTGRSVEQLPNIFTHE